MLQSDCDTRIVVCNNLLHNKLLACIFVDIDRLCLPSSSGSIVRHHLGLNSFDEGSDANFPIKCTFAIVIKARLCRGCKKHYLNNMTLVLHSAMLWQLSMGNVVVSIRLFSHLEQFLVNVNNIITCMKAKPIALSPYNFKSSITEASCFVLFSKVRFQRICV